MPPEEKEGTDTKKECTHSSLEVIGKAQLFYKGLTIRGRHYITVVAVRCMICKKNGSISSSNSVVQWSN